MSCTALAEERGEMAEAVKLSAGTEAGLASQETEADSLAPGLLVDEDALDLDSPSASVDALLASIADAAGPTLGQRVRMVAYTGLPDPPVAPTLSLSFPDGMDIALDFPCEPEWNIASVRVLLNLTDPNEATQLWLFDAVQRVWRPLVQEDWNDLSHANVAVDPAESGRRLLMRVTASHESLALHHFQACACIVDGNGQASPWSDWSQALFVPACVPACPTEPVADDTATSATSSQ